MNSITNLLKKPSLKDSKLKERNEYDSQNQQILYHEKQVKELCALHSLNNLLQESTFTKAILDDLCVQLSPEEFINPHRSVLGLGNYSINIIMKALQLKGYEAIWFDKRRPVTILNLSQVKGFILNVPSDYKIAGIVSLPWKRKHWIAIAFKNNVYYNMDSKLEYPERIGNQEELLNYLNDIVKCKDKELFVIVTKEIEYDGTWRYIQNES